MKKMNKVVASMMVLGMGASLIGTIPMQDLKTVSAQTDATFKIEGVKFKSEMEVGSEISVPLPQDTDATVEVVNPKGKTLKEADFTNVTALDKKFKATIIGTYIVRYIKGIDNSDGKTIYEYKIRVTGETAELKFPTNSSKVIPEKTNYDKPIALPLPKVVDAEGNEIENANVEVDIVTPSYATAHVSNQQLRDGYNLTVNQDGIYTITYKYKGDKTNLIYKTYQVRVKQSYTSSTIELDYELDGTMPTSINRGSSVTLPGVKIKDKNDSSTEVNGYYTIKVVSKATNTEYAVDENNKFVPMEEGAYKVTYTINDFFGSKLSGSTDNTITYEIERCVDSTAPQAKAVKNYNVETEENSTVVKVNADDIIDNATGVISKIYITEGASKEVSFPAIFATDDFEVQKDNDGKYNYDLSKLTLTRTLKDSSGEKIKEWVAGKEDVKANETVSYTFTKTGTYRIEYSAKDSSGNETVGKTYTFDVVNGLEDAVKPVITFEELNIAYARAGETISFKKPTVVDYNNLENKIIGDSRVETHTYYYFDNNDTKIEIKEDKSNSENLAFTLLDSEINGATKVIIITEAVDDAGNSESKEQEIKLIGTGSDETAPEISSGALTLISDDESFVLGYDEEESTVAQNSVVRVDGEIQLTDDDEFFGASVYVRYFKNASDTIGKSVSVNSKHVHENGTNVITLSDINFTANSVGTYVVTVMGKDLTGNLVVRSTSIKVTSNTTPIINVGTMPTNVEIGVAKKLPKVTLDDDDTVEPTIIIEGEGEFELNGYEFTAKEIGEYKVKFVVDTVESEEYVITAEDTTAPTIQLDYNFPETAKYEANEKIAIPGFVATDYSAIRKIEVKVKNERTGSTLSYSSTEENNTVTETETGFEFQPTDNGTYTVTYIAVDEYGNKAEKEYTMKVGDNIEPTITIGNEETNKPGSKKVGDKLTLDLAEITVSDAVDTEINGKTLKELLEDANLKDRVTINVYDPNSNKVSKSTEGEYYNLEEQGQYKIEYIVKDKAGNEEKITHTFQVNAKTTEAGISTETLGIILIVASVLLLGGVIVYFFATRKIVKRPKTKKEE